MALSGISTGFADGTFRPTIAVTRQAMASFLYRYRGEPPVLPAEPFFADVPPDHPFFDAIQWMAATGLSVGSTNPDGGKPLYKPADPVARQAMAAFLYRDAGAPMIPANAPFFADVGTNHPFFDAIQWMADSGLSTGTPDPPGLPLYKPETAVARQAMAAFLYRDHDL